MSTSENNDSTELQKQPTTTTTSRKPNRLVKYILNHKVAFSLLFALIVVFIWAQFSIRRLNKEKDALKVTYAAGLDSLKNENYKTISNVFSWAVRSDLMRNNLDQANQYVENVTKEPYVKKAYLIDVDKKIILLSTNKAENGLPVADITLLQPKHDVVKLNDSTTRFISPITGLNTIIGISVLEVDFRE